MILDALKYARILEELAPLALVSLAALALLATERIRFLRFRTAPAREVPLWSGLDVFLCFVVYIFSQVVAEALGMRLESDLGCTEPVAFLFRQVCWSAIFALFVAVVLWKVHGPRLAPLRVEASSPRNLPPVLLLCAVSFVPLIWIYACSLLFLELAGVETAPQAPVDAFLRAVQAGDELRIILLVLTAVLLAPLAEEVLFRGLLHGLLRLRWGIAAAGVISSAVFALFHFSLGAFLPLFLVGLLLVFVLEKTGSLLYAMLFHAAFNGVQLLAMLAGAPPPPAG
ncbi:MAG: CPBP family intramembrane metalloprotease [Planctomycetes bacterium]|nr:CPBP family intramembrane metalloprotease [Planctomycetota bacterium]